MSRKKHNSDYSVFGVSFVDVFANTLGGLAFILILVIFMIGSKFNVPSINTERLPNAIDGRPYEIWLAARDGGGFYNWHITEGKLPSGLDLTNPSRGLISGTPILESGKSQETFSFIAQVDVEDTSGINKAERNFKITLYSNSYEQLKITTKDPIPNAIHGKEYPLTFAAEGGRSPYVWKINSELKGVKLNQNGLIAGSIEADPGDYIVDVTINDLYNNSASKSFKLKVIKQEMPPPPPPDLEVVTDSFPTAIIGKKYKLALSAQGGKGYYSWSGNTRKTGLKIDNAGFLIGKPTSTGEYKIDVLVRDEESRSAGKKGLILVVCEAPREKITPLQIVTEAVLPETTQGAEYRVSLSANGGTPNYSWKLTKSGKSESIILNSKGQLSFTPKNQGISKFTAKVNDDYKEEIAKEFSVKINPTILPLLIEADKIPDAVKGFRYEYMLNAKGGYQPYQWIILNQEAIPAGLNLSDGKILGTASAAGDFEFSVEVSDAAGKKAKKDLAFEILESGKGMIVSKLKILTETIPVLLKGKEVDLYVATSGGGSPKKWNIKGDLPKGLIFEKGHFYGKLRAAGLFPVEVEVNGPVGQKVSQHYTIDSRNMIHYKWRMIALACIIIACILLIALIVLIIILRRAKKLKLNILTKSIPNARCSFGYRVFLAAQGGIPPYEWSLAKGKLPEGLKLKPEGIIEGIPFKDMKLEDVKDIIFKVKLTDSLGNSTYQKL